jgi:hypothetical protein
MMRLPAVEVVPQFVAFNGGYDTVTPPLALPPSFAREAQNFEQDINGGFTRIAGYERVDGRAKPSDATYAILPMSTLGTYLTNGSVTVTGATSGATGVVIGSSSTAGAVYLVLTKTTGTFQAESLTAGGGVTSGAAVINGAATSQLAAQYNAAAANVYRALIGVVPGSGALRGVWIYNDVYYAFRDNAGGTAVDMYKSTTGGWTKVALGREIKFNTGTGTIADGNTVVGGTSGATAVVARAELESGAWAANAAGHLIFASVTGTFQNGEALKVGGVTQATAISADTAITFAVPGGRFEFQNYNFGGSANTTKMYGCDGKNRGFEFDGTTFVPINTGMTSDAPEHMVCHKGRLFFSFKGSVQFAAAGTPYVWSVIVGAGEIAMGDTVTGFLAQPGGATSATAALGIFTKRNMAVLYGSTSSDFALQAFDQQAGGYAYTFQYVGISLLFNDRGVTSLETSQRFGNFESATLSKRVQPWLRSRRALVTGSCVARDKNQYRLFFSDGSAMWFTHDNGTIVGAMPQLFPDAVKCCCSEQLSDGTEVQLFGSDSGYVFQLEKGTSFDGASIEFFLSMAYNHSGAPRQEKRYRKCTFEISGTGYFEFNFSYLLGYASTEYEQSGTTVVANSLSATNWDSFVWDAFVWDGVNLLPAVTELSGTAENVSLIIRGISDYLPAARISGATIQYSRRRNLR